MRDIIFVGHAGDAALNLLVVMCARWVSVYTYFLLEFTNKASYTISTKCATVSDRICWTHHIPKKHCTCTCRPWWQNKQVWLFTSHLETHQRACACEWDTRRGRGWKQDRDRVIDKERQRQRIWNIAHLRNRKHTYTHTLDHVHSFSLCFISTEIELQQEIHPKKKKISKERKKKQQHTHMATLVWITTGHCPIFSEKATLTWKLQISFHMLP